MLNENLCDKNALAKQLEDFLVRHGGRDGNLLGDAAKGQGDNLNELVCKTLARYELDSRAAADEVKGCSKLLERCKAELAKQNEVIVFEAARADEVRFYTPHIVFFFCRKAITHLKISSEHTFDFFLHLGLTRNKSG
jgi:hypothetical protein